jgi:site-specific recombinase XerD
MKVQRVRLPEAGQVTWMLLDDAYQPDEPVNRFLRFLGSLDRSPNTVRAYAFHLKLFRQYLHEHGVDWTEVTVDDLAGFTHWLRTPPVDGLLPLDRTPARTKRTVYAVLSAVYEFYTYHGNVGATSEIPLYRFVSLPRRRYKDFLYHKTKAAPVKTRVVAVAKPDPEKYQPKTLTPQEVGLLVAACRHLRDRFLVGLLFESGMRIGQALGLRHADVRSWDNEIDIVPREDNANGARAKTRERYTVVVPRHVMDLYTRYVLDELAPLAERTGVFPDYVFVNLWDGQVGRPLAYPTARAMLRRLSQRVLKEHRVNLALRAHMLRHTYATEKIRAGVPLAVVQKQLGHASIATTIQTYTHLTTKDVKVALRAAGAGGADTAGGGEA